MEDSPAANELVNDVPEASPPAVPPRRRRRWPLRLVVAGVVLAVGLAAWWVVWPMVGGAGSSPGPLPHAAVPFSRAHDPAPAGPSGVPELTAQPVWSEPFATGVVEPTSENVPHTHWWDGEAGGILLAGEWADDHYNQVQAVDVTARTSLWTMTGPFQAMRPYEGSGLLLEGDHHLLVVDPRTGDVTAQADWDPEADPIWAITADAIVTRNAATGELCGRTWSDPGTCLWKEAQDPDWHPCGVALVADKWINTDHGVLDAATGEPAPFGADARVYGKTQTLYLGTDGDAQALRLVTGAGCDGFTSYQLWDPVHDTAVAPTVPLAENVYSFSFRHLPWVFERDRNDALTARSALSGAAQWTYTPAPGRSADDRTVAGPYCVVELSTTADSANGGSTDDTYAGMVMLDLASGAAVWSSPEAYWVGASEHVAYVQDDSTLYAYSLEEPGFTLLWSLPLPSAKVGVIAMAGHLTAVDSATGQAWVLQVPAVPGPWLPWPRP